MDRVHGVLARFTNPGELLKAAEKIRDAGYQAFDCHSPFPIHGMDRAMGLKRSRVGYIVGIMTVLGATLGMGFQGWAAAVDYPIIVSGKPFFSWQAFIIITFAMFVLMGAFGAVFGMLHLNRLPRLHHPLFYSEQFKQVTRDAFFVSIESTDDHFDENGTVRFLEELGSSNVELVVGE